MKSERQNRILELVSKYEIETQEDMIERLRAEGFMVTQATVSRDLKELKLRYARRLLLVTEMSATEISEAAGYATQSHFNREFKDYFGTSPLKMRSAGR